MQHSLTVEPLPHFASHQGDSSFDAQHSSNGQPAQPLCGAFDALTGFLLLGCSFGTVSCLHLGIYGSTARRVLGRHAGRVTAACVFPWQAPEHIAAAATVVPSARTASFFATCSADATVKLWTSDAKALHTTDACLQTLRGHRAAVTSLAAVQVAQTWCLLSGSSDGQVLMWRAEAPADSGDQQLSGAAMLAQLVPHMRVTEAPLYTSPHWVLSIACPMQHTEAGVEQGAFIALAQQPLQHVPISKSAVAVTQQTIAASAASTAQQQYRGSTPNSSRPLFGQPHSTLPPSRLSIDALQPAAAAAAQASRLALHNTSRQGSSPAGALGSTANRTACSSPTSTAHTAQRLQRQGSGGSSGGGSSCVSSSCCGSLGMQSKPAAEVSEVPGTQHLSIFAVKFVLQQMAVLTLAYDGACRLHSVVEGVTKCCWRSPTGSFYVAMDVCTGPQGQMVLLGNDKGSLHLYSLTTEKLLATKQIATSRIASIISCDTTGSSSSALSSSGGGARSTSGSGSSRDGTCVQFAVLSEESVGLWQLRQGFSHGIVPGGHRQGVLILQYCGKQLQLASQDLPQLPAAPTLTKSDTISSFFGLSAQQSDTQPAADTAGSSSSSGGSFGSNGGGCGSNGSGGSHAVDSAAGPMLISAGLDGKVIQWDVSGTCPAAMQSVATSAGAVDGSELTAMTYLQGTGIMVTGHDNGQILLWHMDTGSHTVLGPQAHTNSVSCLTPVITVKGDEQFVSGGFDGWVCLWEPRQVRGTKPHLIARFQASCHRPSSPRLVHAQQQQQQQCGHKLPAAGSAPGNAHSSRPVSSSRAVSAAHGKAVGLEQRVSSAAVSAAMLGTQRCSSPLAPGARPSSSSSSGWQHVQQAGGPTRGSSASPCHDGSGNSGSCANSCADVRGSSGGYGSSGSSAIDVLAALQQSPPEILVVLFDPQNQVIITGGNDGLIKVWAGAASGVLLGQHVGHTSPVNCLALDGNLLFSGSHDGCIRMWEVLPPWFSGQGHSGRPSLPTNAAAPAVGPAGTAGSTGSSSSTAEPRGASAATTTSSSSSRPVWSACRSAGYTRGSNTVAASSAFTVLKGHKGSVTGLAVATETGVLVSCGVDGQVLQWDYSTGQVLGRYCLEGQSLLCLAVDSKQVYVGTGHGHLLTIPGIEWVVGGGESSSAILPTA